MQLFMIVVLVALLAVAGGLMAATPLLTPATENFAVTVPSAVKSSPELRRLRTGYIAAVAAATIVASVTSAVAFARAGADAALATGWYLAGFGLVLAVSFAGYFVCRACVRALKLREGWRAETNRTSAVLLGGDDAIRMPSLAWGIAYLVDAALAAGLAWALYPSMPGRIPFQFDFSGAVTMTVEKNFLAAAFPALLVAFLGIVLFASQLAIVHAKRAVNPNAPQASARANLLFTRAQCRYLIGLGVGLCTAVAVVMPLSMAELLSLKSAGVVVVAVVLVCVAFGVRLSFVYGQSGSRLLERWKAAPDSRAMPQDADASWKLGVFYADASDPSVFVPKRFGVGWTLNFARPAAWLCVLALVALVGGLVWLCAAVA
jgi:uncharacterized membrane protein